MGIVRATSEPALFPELGQAMPCGLTESQVLRVGHFVFVHIECVKAHAMRGVMISVRVCADQEHAARYENLFGNYTV
jgi:hypothetical protein